MTYEYDEWGNMLRKLEYAYTTLTQLAEPIANVVLSFNANSPIYGGTVPNLPSSISAAPGTTVTIPNVTPQLNCSPYVYEFASWNSKANGTGTTYRPGQSIRLNSDVTLYAKWRLVYAPPGGGEIAAQPPEKPNEPTRAQNPYPVKAYIYNYADANWKDKLTSIETYNVNSAGHMGQATVMEIPYDSMGNPTRMGHYSYTWEGKQLTGATLTVGSMSNSISYSYNEDGLRTRKTISVYGIQQTTDYYYNGSVLIGMQNSEATQRFSYDAQGKVVSVNYNGTEYYYVRNAQGDIVKLIDGSKNTVVEYTYDSWGKILAVTGEEAASVGYNQPFRYRGYVYDTETGWYYLQSRYYDPSTNRFISSDVYLSTGQGVLGHNSYAYCLNNPVNMSDPFGQWSFWDSLRDAFTAVATVAAVVTIGAGIVALTIGTGGGALVLAGAGIATSAAAATATSVAVTSFAVSATTAIGAATIAAGQLVAQMVGENGTQTTSKTKWKGKDGHERLDVENPNPGQRPGNIHYHEPNNTKHMFDFATRSFKDPTQRLNKLMQNRDFRKALLKAFELLNEAF